MNLSLNIFNSIPCWLIPLLVGAICAILGYLLGRLFGNGNSNNNVDLNVYKNRISKLETDLAACLSKKDTVSRSSGAGNTVASFIGGATAISATTKLTKETKIDTSVLFNASAAKAVFGKAIKQDDLTVVEGIGPKIKELFHSYDVKTWSALANCSVDKCEEVLKSGGKRFEIHKPGTWPKQADFADKGLWQELKDWQDQLDGGK